MANEKDFFGARKGSVLAGAGGLVASVIGFLSGDRWTFHFTQAELPSVALMELDEPTPDRTVLLSGGADSAAGALTAAQPAKSGDCFTVSFQGMGSVSVLFK